MLTGYGYVGLFLIATILFTLTMVLIPIALRLIKIVPSKPSPAKSDTFECGMPTIGKAWVQFNFRYYFYALVFLALDVLAIFLYPWAAGFRQLGWGGFIAALVFIFVIIVGYIYAWKKKVLEWK
ncbi:MAG: NADH-quinone oxidoreductase subunit A [Dehalococcoidales bacterium]|nr:NADH-quinone oxidoreductase subunit A [Dehalococcoidales bacterium]